MHGLDMALDYAIEPSVAICRDAIANAPLQLRILAAYGLGQTCAGLMVRARAAIPTGGDILNIRWSSSSEIPR